MIELTPLARPYAKALFASAIESNTLEDMAVELNTMAVASLEDGVINTIENPTLSRQEIVDILVKLFDDSISETSKKLLSILAENKRLNLLEPIFSIYQDLLEQHKKQKSVEVFVAVDPSDSTKEHIEEKIKATYGNDANISF
ncbi:MAG: ATP synthase F1 subunit delta, partial [Proteobacteria bacterium]|nr:ATP synthase F1 subunit delta [Pseudomonadota bacterium]